jgi:hypothetical protein
MKYLKFIPIYFVAVAAAAGLGCRDRGAGTGQTQTTTGPSVDAEATAVAQLETQQEPGQCRTILQQLDNLPSLSDRPVLTDAQRLALRDYVRLEPAELGEVSLAQFSQVDAHYLAECLLLRAGVRSLRLDGRPPLEQARISFEWVCRMIYIDDRVPYPAYPWMTYQNGFGVGLSRAYAVLAAWQQLGFAGCLVGPPALKDSQSVTLSNRPDAPPTYAPIRACGVKVDKNIYLFDPISGRPIPSSDGKGILTLADARSNPAAAPGQKPVDEAKDWRPFLAPQLACLSTRMSWLQGLRPANSGVVLAVDVMKQKSMFEQDLPGVPCEVWNRPEDELSLTRILRHFVNEEGSSRDRLALREVHHISTIPMQHFPRANLDQSSLEHLIGAFTYPFASLRYAIRTPRDLLLRGQFQQATSLLEDTKQLADNARTRMERDKGLKADVEAWAKRFDVFAGQLNEARVRNPSEVPFAAKALQDFRNQPGNRDIERAFVLGSASRPLAADATYLMAQCVHERAERAQLDNSGQAAANWRNAKEWWNRFLDASVEARSPFPAREAHARVLLERCRQFAPK